MRTLLLIAIASTAACGSDTPVRLVLGRGDTLVLNFEVPTRIPVSGIDRDGVSVPANDVRFERISGATPVSADGLVTCTSRDDMRVRASLGALTHDLTLLCRPVRTVRLADAPLQFVFGDSSDFLPSGPHPIGIAAYDSTNAPVELIAPMLSTTRAGVAAIEGLTLRPLRVGVTLLVARVGNREAAAGVHIYERVHSLDGLRRDQHFAAVPLALAAGGMQRWTLDSGTYMFTMLPYADSLHGLRLRVDDANCMKESLSPRRHSCFTPRALRVTVWHPGARITRDSLRGELLVRRLAP